ncbi:MAG TPA: ABC transporter substrate-binding protein [Candidatus Binatia bacterium]|nr:ABC transporter substrate-binding protein [Candidatus Binatia bacterium]
MPTSFSFRTAILASMFFILLWSPAVQSAEKLIRLNVGYSAISFDQLPAWVAKETGLFAKNGLDVQLVYFTGGTTAVMALVSGDISVSQNAGPEVANLYLGGSDPVLIAGGTITLDYWLMSRPDLKSAEQLRGGSVAISRFGSVSDFIARFALQRIGLVPEKDVTIVQLGTTTDRLAALATRRVEATVLNPPTMFIAQKNGLNLIADVSALGLAFQHAGAATSRRFIREQPDIVRRYVRSHVEAVHRIKTDRETGLKVAMKYFGTARDKESMEKSYTRYISDDKLPRKQYPTLEGIKTVLTTLGEKDPKARAIKPEDLVDLRFIRELDQSGFIDSLYAR